MKNFFSNFEKNANNFVENWTKQGSFGRAILSKIVSALSSLINFIGIGRRNSSKSESDKSQDQTQVNGHNQQTQSQKQTHAQNQQTQSHNQTQSPAQIQQTQSQNYIQTQPHAQNQQTQGHNQTHSPAQIQQTQSQNYIQTQLQSRGQQQISQNQNQPQSRDQQQTQPHAQNQQTQAQNQNQSNAQNQQTHTQNYAQPQINYKDRGFCAPSILYPTRINEFIHVKNQGENIFFDKKKSGIICRIKASDLRPKEKKGEETLLILADPDLDLEMVGESKTDYGPVSTEVSFTYKEKHEKKPFKAIFKVNFGRLYIDLHYGKYKFSIGSIDLSCKDSYIDIYYSKSDGTFECKSVTYGGDLGAEMNAKFPIIFDTKNTKSAVVNVMQANPISQIPNNSWHYYRPDYPGSSREPVTTAADIKFIQT